MSAKVSKPLSRIDSNRRFEPLSEHQRGPDMVAKFLSKWPTRCLNHEEAIVSFCVDHDQLVCNVCVLSDHKECNSIMGIAEASKGMRGSRECAILDANLKKLRKKYEKSLETQTTIMENLIEQDREFVKAVRSFRDEINVVLDQLEHAIIAKKDDFATRKKDIIKGHKRACKSAMTHLESFNKELDKSFLGPDEQSLFLMTKKTKTVIQRFEEQMDEISKEPKRVTIQFLPNVSIDKFFLSLKEFGTMKVDDASKDLLPALTTSKNAERRLSIATSEKIPLLSSLEIHSDRSRRSLPNIGNTQKATNVARVKTRKPLSVGEVTIHLDTDTEVPFISGVSFMPDDRIAVADDANKNVKLFTSAFKPISMAKLTSPPRDITPVKSTEVCVTIPTEKCLQFIDVGKHMLLRKKVQLDIECSGITMFENELYVTSGFSKDRQIQVISLNGDVRKRIRPGIADLRYPLYIAVDAKYRTIFVTDYNHGVIGIDINSGAVQFKCKDTDVHGYYKGITIGNKGHIYTCTWSLHGVSRVHLDGRGLETIVPMPDKEGRKPHSIAFSNKSSQMIVSLCGGKRGALAVFKFQ